MKAVQTLIARGIAAVLILVLSIQPVAAQSLLRDTETEQLFKDMSAPLIKAAGLDPKNVDVVLVNDPSVNAFVAGGQAVYVNSGLINMAESANEVQGVIAHELGHVVGGHAINDGGAKAASGISILSLLLGGLAMAAGGGEAGMAVMAAGQQAAMGKYLAFSRGQEESADAAGAKFLSGAGITGKGSVSFFRKLQNMEFRYGYGKTTDEDAFWSTHPLTGDRIQYLSDTYQADPAWAKPSDPGIEARFKRVKAKLYGYLAEPSATLKAYPVRDSSLPAHYARAYAYHKDALLDKAMAETEALLLAEPNDPYFLELKGQILLESGHPGEAVAPLRKATENSGNAPLIASMLGHALIATEDSANFAEAERVLKTAVARDRDNPFAWYQLGVVYEHNGETAKARLASAEQQVLSGNMAEASRSAKVALGGLPTGSADWLRAQDIAMQADAALEKNGKRR